MSNWADLFRAASAPDGPATLDTVDTVGPADSAAPKVSQSVNSVSGGKEEKAFDARRPGTPQSVKTVAECQDANAEGGDEQFQRLEPTAPQSVQCVKTVKVSEGESAQTERVTEPPAPRPYPKHRRLVDGLLQSGLQRPPSWADPAARPPPGAWCGCCGRFDPRKGGRWWRDLRGERKGGAPGWACATCHPPDHLTPGEHEAVRT